MFIVIEGIDLIGKTTQADMLVRHLRDQGRAAASYSFPAYDSPAGEAISDHLRGEVMLSERRYKPAGGSLGSSGGAGCEEEAPARSRHDSLVFQCLQLADKYAAAPLISTSLRLDQTVVACRWWQSALTYGAESGLDEGWVGRTCHCLPRADVNVLLDLDPARARRRPGAPPDRLEADLARQEGVRRRYLDLWRRCDGEHGFWAVVDGEGGADVVHRRILDVLDMVEVYRPRDDRSSKRGA